MEQSETPSEPTEAQLPFDPENPRTAAQLLLVRTLEHKRDIEEMLAAYPELSYANALRQRVSKYERRITRLLDFIDRGEPPEEWPLKRPMAGIVPVNPEFPPEEL